MTLARYMRAKSSYVITAIVALFLHLFYAIELYRTVDRVLAWMLLVTFLATVYRELTLQSRGVPWLPLAAFQSYLMFGAAQFTQRDLTLLYGIYVPAPWAITSALLVALLSDFVLIAAFIIVSRRDFSLALLLPHPSPRWRTAVVIYSALSLPVHFLSSVRPDLVDVAVRNILLRILNPYLAITLLLYLGFRHRSESVRRYSTMYLVALVLIGLWSSMMELVVVPLFIYIVASWIWRDGVRLKWIVIAIAAFLILNPVKYHYRQLAEFEQGVTRQSFVEAAALWKESFARAWSDPLMKEDNLRTASNRTTYLLQLAQVVEWVPERVGYRGYTTLLSTFGYFIPRVVWPEKPSISALANNEYALAFGHATPKTLERVTIGIVQPLDGYWAGGYLGAIIFVALKASAIALLFFAGPRHDIDLIMATVFTASFFQVHASLHNTLASIFSILVGAGLALYSMHFSSLVFRSPGRVHGGVAEKRVPSRR